MMGYTYKCVKFSVYHFFVFVFGIVFAILFAQYSMASCHLSTCGSLDQPSNSHCCGYMQWHLLLLPQCVQYMYHWWMLRLTSSDRFGCKHTSVGQFLNIFPGRDTMFKRKSLRLIMDMHNIIIIELCKTYYTCLYPQFCLL